MKSSLNAVALGVLMLLQGKQLFLVPSLETNRGQCEGPTGLFLRTQTTQAVLPTRLPS